MMVAWLLLSLAIGALALMLFGVRSTLPWQSRFRRAFGLLIFIALLVTGVGASCDHGRDSDGSYCETMTPREKVTMAAGAVWWATVGLFVGLSDFKLEP